MNKSTLITNAQKLIKQRNIFLLFSFSLSLAVTLLSILLFSKKERTIIVPLTGTPSWIEESQSSQNYLENMGTFLSDLLLSRSPADVTWRNEHLLKHVHPAFYHQISSKLKEEEAFLTQQDQSFVFRPERSFANPSQMTFTIEGESLIIITRAGADPTCAQREKKRYVLIFMCENQKLLLTALNQETILP